MEKEQLSTELRLLLAFALSFAIVLLSRSLLVRPTPPSGQKAVAKQANAEPSTPAAARPVPSVTIEPPLQATQGATEQQVTVENDLYQVTFSSRGAVVKSWALKTYRDEMNNPLELVDPVAARQFGYPFSLWVADEALRREVNNALFRPSATGRLKAPVTLTFEYSGGRIAARKEIVITEKGYVAEVKTDLWTDGTATPHAIAWWGGFGDVHDIGMRGNVVDVYYRDQEKMVHLTPTDIKGEEVSASGLFSLAGIEDRFFAGTFLTVPTLSGETAPPVGSPTEGTKPRGETPERIADGGQAPLRVIAFRQDVSVASQQRKRPSVGVAVGSLDSPQNRLRLFVGPKDTEILAAVSPRMPELVDYGWFTVVAKPLFLAMRWIHDHIIPNYGWSIIFLTVFINFALFPLKVKSLRSGMKMQKLQPQIRAIQDKYKQYKMKDPRKQKMNEELMALYKEHGVNPIGGCLPMLLQMPFLYGFYKVLVVSIEMRHAPWIWWIHDLSAPESLAVRVLPLTMCVTQFVLQRMSPATSPDPAQQKMMMFMPVMFLFLFWNFSSGLVLYWLTGNLVGIAQQWFINRTELQHLVEEKKRAASKRKQALARK